jgi:hypothetical protein
MEKQIPPLRCGMTDKGISQIKPKPALEYQRQAP